MSVDAYIRMSCGSCESQYAVDYRLEEVSIGTADYCPFCGEVVVEDDFESDSSDEDEKEEEYDYGSGD